MQAIRLIAATVLIVGSALVLHPARAQQPGIKRTDLQRHDLSAPGREVVQVRVDLAPGVTFGKHWHPGEEIVYVIEGTLEYHVEGKPPVTLKAGDVLFIPARTIHAAKNVGSDNGAELATYFVEKGKPLVVMADAEAAPAARANTQASTTAATIRPFRSDVLSGSGGHL
jgi:quercetin dioxygenase-like cupin family protein